MTNEKTIQFHTHKIQEGAECNPERPCAPMGQALRRRWFLDFNALPMGIDGALRRGVCIGDLELGYLSLFRWCPFCGVDMQVTFPRYAPFHEGEPVMNRVDRTEQGA